MPLLSLSAELQRAREGRYAVPCFDVFDVQSAEGVFAALEDKRAPAAIGLWGGVFEQPNARALTAYLRARAEDAPVPVSLILDHGRSFEDCARAISYGFTDVMYDGSALPLADNIANTRRVVEAAHPAGVCVEAELGRVGLGRDYQAYGARRQGFTDPDSVAPFVAETGVDFLAVAIGTAHGLYDGEPQVDLGLLREIRARVDLPLVLHGGSGCSDEQFRAVIAAGMSKINVATDLFVTAGERLVEAARAADPSYFSLSKAAVEAFRARCAHYLDVFGAAGRA